MARTPSLSYNLIALLLSVAGALRAQTTFATITGTVTGATGAEIITKSNEAGIYTLAQLKEGEYTVRAQGAGFKEKDSSCKL